MKGFPAYRTRNAKLAPVYALIGDKLIDSQGNTTTVSDYADIFHIQQETQPLLLVDNTHNDRIASALFANAEALLDDSHNIHAYRHHIGRTVCWSVRHDLWPVPLTPGGLTLLERAFVLLGTGNAPTPSSLGLRLMRQLYPLNAELVTPPRLGLYTTLYQNRIGGRADLVADSDRTYRIVHEFDINSAYPAALCQVPQGNATKASKPTRRPWYGYVTIHIPDLPLGPVAVRDSDGILRYPTNTTVHGWYWDVEAETAAEYGCSYVVHKCYVWDGYTNAFELWSHTLHKLRKQHPDIANIIKVASVAAIGRFLSPPEQTILSLKPGSNAKPYVNEQGLTDLWINTIMRRNDTQLTHIGSYVLASVRMRLFTLAYRYAANNSLLATNYDAIYTIDATPPEPLDPERLGGIKHQVLEFVRFPHARWIESRTKLSRPGFAKHKESARPVDQALRS